MARILYKYRGDSKFTDGIITSGKVFLATAHELNDPFECTLQEISKSWVDEQIKNSMQASLAGFSNTARLAKETGKPFFGLSSKQAKAAIKAILSAGDLGQCFDAYRTFVLERTGHAPSDIRTLFARIDAQLVETGIFSMSCDPIHPLMWSHYADQHRGLCLGFRETPGSKLADPEHCLPVTYSDELPRMEGSGLQLSMTFGMDGFGKPYTMGLKLAFTDKTFQRVVTTKSKHWAYEQEVRYIEPFGGLSDWPGQLAECTFGLRCHEGRRKHYIDLLEAHVPNDVLLFECVAIYGTNEIGRRPLDPPVAHGKAVTPVPGPAALPATLTAEAFGAKMQQLLQQQRYGDVIFQTSENLKRNPSQPALLHMKATAHGLAGEHAAAFAIYEQLAQAYPGVAAGPYGMACALESMGQTEEVVPLLRRAAQLDPNDPSIALNLGVHLAFVPETQQEGLAQLRRAEKLGHRRARQIINQIERGD